MTTIQNKNQWFLMLNEMSDKVKDYESSILQYKNATKIKLDISRPLTKNFYNKNNHIEVIFKKLIKKIPIALIISAIIWVIMFFIFLSNSEEASSDLIKTFELAGASIASKAIIFAIIALFATLGCIGLFSSDCQSR